MDLTGDEFDPLGYFIFIRFTVGIRFSGALSLLRNKEAEQLWNIQIG